MWHWHLHQWCDIHKSWKIKKQVLWMPLPFLLLFTYYCTWTHKLIKYILCTKIKTRSAMWNRMNYTVYLQKTEEMCDWSLKQFTVRSHKRYFWGITFVALENLLFFYDIHSLPGLMLAYPTARAVIDLSIISGRFCEPFFLKARRNICHEIKKKQGKVFYTVV